MNYTALTSGIAEGRLPLETLATNFQDYGLRLDHHEAHVEADRCYFCHDAPCVTACPTEIDIPLFIRQISTGTADAAALTILSSNVFGGMCARVCPTETLCEGACVRMDAESKPVEIGALQRYATDRVLDRPHPFARAAATGKRVAIIGAGPAGLSCAHRLAMHGHNITVYEARPKPGGLNEYGLAAYKASDEFAALEVDWLLQIGGITVETGKALGRDITLDGLQNEFDAVFLGIGLGEVNTTVLGEGLTGVSDAVDFIEDLRQCDDLTKKPVGRDVVVIGGGMTAVDAGVQARLLGAETVTICYRRGPERLSASWVEQEHATKAGVRIRTNATPIAIRGDAEVKEIEFAYTADDANGRMVQLPDTFTLKADQVLFAIGQVLSPLPEGFEKDGAKIAVTAEGRTSRAGVWAGGDCTRGEDLTVVAVAEGRDAAEDIHATLMGGA